MADFFPQLDGDNVMTLSAAPTGYLFGKDANDYLLVGAGTGYPWHCVLDDDNYIIFNLRSVSLDAAIQKTFSRSVALDAAIQATLTKAVSLDAPIQDTFTKTVDFDASLALGRTVKLDAPIQDTFTKTMDLDARLANGVHVSFDAVILFPTQDRNADRHRFKGTKEAGFTYGEKTQTTLTYARGLEPGEQD